MPPRSRPLPPRHGGATAVSRRCRAPPTPPILHDHDYDTAAFVHCPCSTAASPRPGFDLDQLPRPRCGRELLRQRSSSETSAPQAPRRNRHPPAPSSCGSTTTTTHPYDPRPGSSRRQTATPTAARSQPSTTRPARLLPPSTSGLSRSTLVVLTADHGEAGRARTHTARCATRRRCVLSSAFRAPPRPGPRLASLVDLLPTILGRLGIAAPKDPTAWTCSPLSPPDRGVCSGFSGYLNYGWSRCAGPGSTGAASTTFRGGVVCRAQDPGERQNLGGSNTRVQARPRAHRGLLARPALENAPAERQQLAAALAFLGYATGADPLADLPSPPRAIRSTQSGRARAGSSRCCAHPVQGVSGVSRDRGRIVRTNPQHLLALDLMSLCMMQAGRFDEARRPCASAASGPAPTAPEPRAVPAHRAGRPRPGAEGARTAERLAPEGAH
jgi:hypothetical protein